jgi:hypothetical protein
MGTHHLERQAVLADVGGLPLESESVDAPSLRLEVSDLQAILASVSPRANPGGIGTTKFRLNSESKEKFDRLEVGTEWRQTIDTAENNLRLDPANTVIRLNGTARNGAENIRPDSLIELFP